MHKINRSLTGQEPLHVAVVGVGGTGSEVVSGLLNMHHALKALGRGGLVVHAFDPDEVSQANLVRQRYHAADLGKNKAEVLIRRVNAAAGLNWQATPRRFTGSVARGSWDLVISCVDTRAARAELHRYAFASGLRCWKLWMDYGNEKDFAQVVLGEPRGPNQYKLHALPCATELHPELIDTSEPEDDAPSCSALEALAKQDLMINKLACDLGLALLWEALSTGALRFHGYYLSLENGVAQALPVPKQPAPTRKSRREKADTPPAARRGRGGEEAGTPTPARRGAL